MDWLDSSVARVMTEAPIIERLAPLRLPNAQTSADARLMRGYDIRGQPEDLLAEGPLTPLGPNANMVSARKLGR